jgi:hypothetical protein
MSDMQSKTVIYQPCYYPKLHYLARINDADQFIIFDDVEFSRRSRQHRAEINFGDKQWLTIPVQHTGAKTLINEAKIDNSQRWQDKHMGTLKHKYGGDATLFQPYYDRTEQSDEPALCEFTSETLLELMDQFGIKTETHYSSEIPISHPGDPSEYLAELTQYVSGDTYVCGQGVYDEYLDETVFASKGIDIEIQYWTPEWSNGNVCSLNVLFNADTPEEYVQ